MRQKSVCVYGEGEEEERGGGAVDDAGRGEEPEGSEEEVVE